MARTKNDTRALSSLLTMLKRKAVSAHTQASAMERGSGCAGSAVRPKGVDQGCPLEETGSAGATPWSKRERRDAEAGTKAGDETEARDIALQWQWFARLESGTRSKAKADWLVKRSQSEESLKEPQLLRAGSRKPKERPKPWSSLVDEVRADRGRGAGRSRQEAVG